MEPLHPLPWGRSLRDILASMMEVEPGGDAARLRKLYHLLALTPPPLTQWFASNLPEGQFELLVQRAPQAAALALLGDSFDFALTRDSSCARIALTLRRGKAPPAIEIVDDTTERAVVRALCELALSLLDECEAPSPTGKRRR